MLTIRHAQVAVFDAHARRRFDLWLVGHVHQYWDDRVARIGDEDRLAGILTAAVAQAQDFGIERSANVARYVDLVMLLGAGFAQDTRISWAGDILRTARFDEERKLRAIDHLLDAEGLDDVAPEWGWP